MPSMYNKSGSIETVYTYNEWKKEVRRRAIETLKEMLAFSIPILACFGMLCHWLVFGY